MDLILNESASVKLDGSGNGSVRFSPDEPAMQWKPTLVTVSVATAVNEAVCSIYAGPSAAPQYLVDATFTGSSGNSSDRVTGYVIARTRTPYIWVVWSGGDPGAQATAIVNGTKAKP